MRFIHLRPSCLLFLVAVPTAACGDESPPADVDYSFVTADGGGDGDSLGGSEEDAVGGGSQSDDTAGGDSTGGSTAGGDSTGGDTAGGGSQDEDSPGDEDEEGGEESDGALPGDGGVDGDHSDAGPSQQEPNHTGVCGGDTPHGCYEPVATNPSGCTPQIFEQSGFYPPLEEWQGCGNVLPFETCFYNAPDGRVASCTCDTGLHWLCIY